MPPRPRLLAGLAVLGAVAALTAPGAAVPPPGDDPAAVGRWDAPLAWPTQAIHAAMLPTGKVLTYGTNAGATLWDPAAGTFRAVPIPGADDMVCSGMALLADGRLLLNGGHAQNGTELWNGHRLTFVFDPATETWARAADMNHGRYYPGTVTLGTGEVLTVNGNGEHGADPGTSEIWDGTTWRYVPGASPPMEFYPRMHVMTDGRVVSAGQDPNAMLLDPATGTWTVGPRSEAGRRWGGVSVLLPGLDRVLVFGGGNSGASSEGHNGIAALRDSPERIAMNHFEAVTDGAAPGTTSTEVLDLAGTPTYRTVAPMLLPRRDHAGVLLADGTVLALGGSVGYEPVPGWADYAFHPELFDPRTEAWSLMAPAERTRGYHSTGLLLPDGRVLFAGGDFEQSRGATAAPLTNTGEVWSPPYLFRGPRPAIVSAPSAAAYGERFSVLKSGPRVARAALVRLGSATHSLNTDQRWVGLDVEEAGDLLHLRAPASANATPPGWYMLFLLSEDGVPSVSTMVRLG